jgi:hypothetical protein
MMRSPILIVAALALALTTAPVFATSDHGKDRSCDDGKGNWHYCFVPDDDPAPTVPLVPIYEVVSTVGTVKAGKTISVEAKCSDKFYAMSGSFKTDTPVNGVRRPQRIYVTGIAPTFPAGMDQTNSAPIGEMVTVINSSMRVVDVTAFATCMAMTTP